MWDVDLDSAMNISSTSLLIVLFSRVSLSYLKNSLSWTVSSMKYTFSSHLYSIYRYLFQEDFYLWPLLRLCMHSWSCLFLRNHYLMTSLYFPHYKQYLFYFPFMKAIIFYPCISHLRDITLNWITHNDFYYYFSYFYWIAHLSIYIWLRACHKIFWWLMDQYCYLIRLQGFNNIITFYR